MYDKVKEVEVGLEEVLDNYLRLMPRNLVNTF